jgi:hypothetical protein
VNSVKQFNCDVYLSVCWFKDFIKQFAISLEAFGLPFISAEIQKVIMLGQEGK